MIEPMKRFMISACLGILSGLAFWAAAAAQEAPLGSEPEGWSVEALLQAETPHCEHVGDGRYVCVIRFDPYDPEHYSVHVMNDVWRPATEADIRELRIYEFSGIVRPCPLWQDPGVPPVPPLPSMCGYASLDSIIGLEAPREDPEEDAANGAVR